MIPPAARLARWLRSGEGSPLRGNAVAGPGFTHGCRCTVWAPRRLVIGADVGLGSDVRIEVDGEIGDGAMIANGAAIVGRSDHALDDVGVPIRYARWVGHHPEALSRPVHIGSDVWIGFGAIVLSGVRIGDSSVVGAGAVVTRDVPPNTIVAGNPAAVVRNRFTAEEFEEHWRRLDARGIRRHPVPVAPPPTG